MSQEPYPLRRHVNWRVAAMLNNQSRPVFGYALEADDATLILQFINPFPSGMELQIFLDIPDPRTRQPTYVDCQIKVMESTLMGRISQFRHICSIRSIQPQQQAFFKRVLSN